MIRVSLDSTRAGWDWYAGAYFYAVDIEKKANNLSPPQARYYYKQSNADKVDTDDESRADELNGQALRQCREICSELLGEPRLHLDGRMHILSYMAACRNRRDTIFYLTAFKAAYDALRRQQPGVGHSDFDEIEALLQWALDNPRWNPIMRVGEDGTVEVRRP